MLKYILLSSTFDKYFSTISKKTMKLLVVSLSLFLSISQWATAQNTTEKEYLLKGSALYEAGELDSLISYSKKL
jgi:hypothetical protein